MIAAVQQQTQILRRQLQQGLGALDLTVSAEQQQRYLDYLFLLQKWNSAYNLSAVRDVGQMLSRHVLDSLSLVPYFTAPTCLDVGSGAGLPGIPLAITFPERQFTLIDSNGKKTRFLFQALTELGLKNVTVEQGRVEEKTAPPLFAGIVCRAFSAINAILDSCSHLLARDGVVYAMKGRYPADELTHLVSGFKVSAVQRLQVPVEVGERHLVILHKL